MIGVTKRRETWRALACLVAAALIGLKLTAFIERVRDLGLNDETLYLASGVNLFRPGYPNLQNGLPPPDWSPVYAVYYRLLYAIDHDRVAIYYLNWKLLVVASTVALYLLQRRVRVGPLVALTTSFFFATSAYFDVWPYPMDFAVLLMLAGTTVAASARSWNSTAAVLGVTFVLCAFVRPELTIAAILFVAAWAIIAARSLRSGAPDRRRLLAQGSALAVVSGGLVGTFGSPLGGERGFYAFAQHYAFDVASREALSTNPWLHWRELTARDFGRASTIGEAARANPGAFARHMWHDVLATPHAFAHVADTNLYMPSSPMLDTAWDVARALALVAAIIGLRAAWKRRGRPSRRRPLVVVTLVTAVVTASVSGGIIVVYPRDHYLLPLVALLLVQVGVTLSALGRRVRLTASGPVTVALACALVALTRNRAAGWSPQTAIFHTGVPDTRLPVRWTVDELKRLDIEKHVVALELGWGYVFYAGYDAHRVVEWAKTEPFFAYMRDEDISVMVLTDEFLQHPQFERDADFKAFLADPTRYGFRVIHVPQSSIEIVLRHDVDPG